MRRQAGRGQAQEYLLQVPLSVLFLEGAWIEPLIISSVRDSPHFYVPFCDF